MSLRRLLILSFLVAAAAILLQVLPARAAEDAAADGGIIDLDHAGGGMPGSNPRVEPILAAHPNQFVVICVAGCDGKPRPVQILPRPVTGREGAMVTTSGKTGNEVGPSRPEKVAAETSDVTCVAGCDGRPGQVLQHMTGLPATPKPAPKTSEK